MGATMMQTHEDRAVWRVWIRRGACYTSEFPAYFAREDVLRRLDSAGLDVLDVEPVT
jgi:hypothetical protein